MNNIYSLKIDISFFQKLIKDLSDKILFLLLDYYISLNDNLNKECFYPLKINKDIQKYYSTYYCLKYSCIDYSFDHYCLNKEPYIVDILLIKNLSLFKRCNCVFEIFKIYKNKYINNCCNVLIIDDSYFFIYIINNNRIIIKEGNLKLSYNKLGYIYQLKDINNVSNYFNIMGNDKSTLPIFLVDNLYYLHEIIQTNISDYMLVIKMSYTIHIINSLYKFTIQYYNSTSDEKMNEVIFTSF